MENKQRSGSIHQNLSVGPESRENPNQGCQASIRHPVKVNPSPLPVSVKVLTNNIDTLYLSIDVTWENDLFFQYLTARQEEAKHQDAPVPVEIIDSANENLLDDEDDCLPLFIKPTGLRGYKWVLVGRE